MRFGRLGCLALLVPFLPISAQQSQAKPIAVTIGAGVLFADNGEEDIQSSRGVTGFVRLNRNGLPLQLEASIQHMPRNTDIVFAAVCPPAPAPCTAPFIGPTTALTFAPALQLTKRDPGTPKAAILFRAGPSVSWHVGRQDGSRQFAVGARTGVSLRLGQQADVMVVSVDVFRLFNAGSSPGWYVPITLGIEF